MNWENAGVEKARPGLTLLQVLILLLFCIFSLRLWYLQVHKGDFYSAKSRENRIRRHSVYAPRGLIFDRNNTLLAKNEPAYSLAVVREDCRDIDQTLSRISELTGIELEKIRANFSKGRRRVKSFENQVVVQNISFELLARVEASSIDWPGLNVVVQPRRNYTQGPALSHILGYVAQANEEELGRNERLALGDNIGKSGIEQVCEGSLRGEKGIKEVEVDASSRIMDERLIKAPLAGENIKLSIDLKLQEVAASQLQGQTGAVVVMEPYSGDILALVSEPGYDNNAFVRGLTSSEWSGISSDPMHPLQNRPLQSTYPPGSVFKLVMAGCALENGVVSPSEQVFCPGQFRLGRRVFRCWRKQGHGLTDLRKSLVQSCDVYYYQAAKKLGVDKISVFAKACGFGKSTGIALPNEKKGLIPDREWKRRVTGHSWQGGETINMSIGQGDVLVTPLQIACFVSALVNGGFLLEPQLEDGARKVVRSEIPFSAKSRSLVLEAMVETVQSDRGTARRIRQKGARVGGKTGTVQVVKLMDKFEKKETEEIPYRFRDHAWLASFGEKDGNAYVVVAFIEHGGHGGSAAGPVVKKVYDYLFS